MQLGEYYGIREWNDYVALACRTAPENGRIRVEHHTSESLSYGRSLLLQGACTVAGELSEYKKVEGSQRPLEDYIDELGDVYWGLALITKGVNVLTGQNDDYEGSYSVELPLEQTKSDYAPDYVDAITYACSLVEMAESVAFQREEPNVRGIEARFGEVGKYLLSKPDVSPKFSIPYILGFNVAKLENRHL